MHEQIIFDGFATYLREFRLAVVFSCDEVKRLFGCMDGTTKLMAQLIYGAGLRLMECITLRIKDIISTWTGLSFAAAKATRIEAPCYPAAWLGR